MSKNKKPRNKKYSLKARRLWQMQRRVDEWYQGNVIAFREDWEESHAFDVDGVEVPMTYDLGKAVLNTPYKWSLLVCVIGRRQDGQCYIKTELLDTNITYQQNLTDVYYQYVDEIKKNFNPLHFVTSGWILGNGDVIDTKLNVDKVMLPD